MGPGERTALPTISQSLSLLTGLVCLAALVYVGARAALVPITHDEAFGYLNFFGHSWERIFSFRAPGSVNNHVLNSVLARLSTATFGVPEWALRLPNVLAFALYLGSGVWIARRLSSAVATLVFLVLLVCNPFLLEFFGLARGYGLGLAFLELFAALLLSLGERDDPGLLRGTAAGLAGALAMASNFSFFLPVGAFALVSALRLRNRPLAFFAGVLPPLVVCAAVFGPWIASLRAAGQLYAGGEEFVRDTLGVLAWRSVAEAGWGPLGQTGAWVAALVCAALGVAALIFPAAAAGRRIAGLFVPALALCVAGSVLLHRLFGTPYPMDRTALFFLPLLAASGAAGIDVLASAAGRFARAVGSVTGSVLVLAAVWNGVRSANLDHAQLWSYDADAKRVITDLGAMHQREGIQIHVGGNWTFEPALNFYRVTRRLDWLDPIARNDPFERCNVLLLSVNEPLPYAPDEFLEIRRYPRFGNFLLRRVKPADSGQVQREDPALTGSIDEPAEGDVVYGDLRVGGWAREAGRDLGVTIFLDGAPRAENIDRFPRPDVAAALPSLGDCASAGYKVRIPFEVGLEGARVITVVLSAENDRVRHLSRQFVWRNPRTGHSERGVR